MKASLFPLSLDSPATCLQTFGGFTGDQMRLITGTNEQMHEPTDPVGHLLAFKEEEYLAVLAGIYERKGKPLDAPGAQRYRAGVCIGNTIMQREIDEQLQAGMTVPTLKVDPGRRYFTYPEVMTDKMPMRYYAEVLIGRLSGLYLDTAVQQHYFSGAKTVQSAYGLREAWRASGMDFLLDERHQDIDEAFGEVARGIFHTLRLYRTLECEEQLAPASESVYNPKNHTVIGDQTEDLQPKTVAVSTSDELRRYRRWSNSFDTWSVAQNEDGEEYLERHKEVGARYVPDRSIITRVGRCLTGFVQVSESEPDMLVKVAFNTSVEEYDLRPDDVLIARWDSAYGALDGLVVGRRHRPGTTELLALIRDGHAIPLHDLDGEPLNEALADILTIELCRDKSAAYILSNAFPDIKT